MADPVKKLLVQFDADTSKGIASIKGINDETNKTSGFFGKALGGLTAFVGGTAIIGIATGAFSLLTGTVKDLVSAGEDAQVTESQTVAVLKSTHGAAGMTAKAIEELATKYMRLTGVDDDVIQGAENILLGFTHIGKQVFPQATQAALDLSQRFGVDLPTATRLLGATLDDPAKGLGRLTRYTGQLSQAQQDSIAHFLAVGDVADAQKVILDKVAQATGGAAVAYGQTFAGQLKIFNAEAENAKETIGASLLPIMTDLLHAVTPLASALGDGLAKGAKIVADDLNNLKPYVTALVTDGKALWDSASGLASAFMSGLKPALDQIGAAIGPVGPSAKDVAGAFKSFGEQAKHLQTLTPIVKTLGQTVGKDLVGTFHNLETVWKAISPYVKELADGIGKGLSGAAKAMWPDIQQGWKAFQQFDQELVEKGQPAIKAIWDAIQTAMPVIKAIWNATWPVIQDVFSGVWDVIKGVVKVAFAIVSGTIKFWLDVISGNWKGAWNDIKDMLGGIMSGLGNIISGAQKILLSGWTHALSGVKDAAGKFGSWLHDVGKNAVKALGDGFGAMGNYAVQAIKNIAQNVLNGIKNIFGIHSPSKVFGELGAFTSLGFTQGLQSVDVAGAAEQHFSKVGPAVARAMSRTGTTGTTGGGSGGATISAQAALAASAGSGGASGDGRMLQISVLLDSEVIGRATAPVIVDEIRVQTGVMA